MRPLPKNVTLVTDTTRHVFESISALVGKRVLVGIPDDRTDRQAEEDTGPVTNAALGYIHEFGSPAANIPARPFLIPGIKAAESSILYQMRKAADAALVGKPGLADQALNAAGIVASNSVRLTIQSNIPPPLSPETIRNRRRARGTKKMRESEQVYLRLISQGVSPGAAQKETGIIALYNTGQLMRSITYVIRARGKSNALA